MTSRDAFKLGFIKQCRDAGLTDEQIFERAEQALAQKTAGIMTTLDNATSGIRSGVESLWAGSHQNPEGAKPIREFDKRLLALSFGIPLVAGGLGGAAASKLKGNFVDDDDVKNREVIDELHRQTDLAKQNQRAARAP